MKIAHISDIHFNYGTDFNLKVYEKAVKMVNKINPDMVFISGDLTTDGLLSEYDLAKEKIKEIEIEPAVVPGNHDEKNLGFKLFREVFGESDFIKSYDNINLVGLASSEPDKDDGRLGSGRHQRIEQAIKKKNKIPIIGFHHHLIHVPNSGREANIIEDAGETLDIILKNEIPLVLMGHRHVQWAVKIHKTLLVNAGTLSCNRTRAHLGNTFNIININENKITVTVVNVRKDEQEKMIEFNFTDGCCVNKYYD